MLRFVTRPGFLWLSALALGGGVAGCASLDEWQRQAIFDPRNGNQRWYSEPPAGTEQFDVKLTNGHPGVVPPAVEVGWPAWGGGCLTFEGGGGHVAIEVCASGSGSAVRLTTQEWEQPSENFLELV